jgi:hypothetical protein
MLRAVSRTSCQQVISFPVTDVLKSNVGKIAGGVELGSGWSGVICEGTIRQRGKDLVEWLVESFVLLAVMKFNPTTQTQNIFFISVFHLIMLN